MDRLTRKYGPLPGYAWMLIAAGGLYVYMRMRSGSQQAAATAAGQAAQDASGGGFDTGQGMAYGAGYDTGYSAGNALAAPTVTQAVPPGYKYGRQMRDPSGKLHIVYGQGHWVHVIGRGWEWAQGLPRVVKRGTSTHGGTLSYPIPRTPVRTRAA